VGVFLFSLLCLIGSSVFAAGTYLRGTSAMLPILLLGRLLFGSGNGSLTSQFLSDLSLSLINVWCAVTDILMSGRVVDR